MLSLQVTCLLAVVLGYGTRGVLTGDVEVDPKGYVVYCPCMGRFGNQADHFLGSLSFARVLDRTLILPPWVEYPNHKIGGSDQIPFDTYFQVKAVQEFHRAITMEKFMNELAPKIWPPGKRISFCYMARHGGRANTCNAKDGNPFGPFWDKFNINFDSSEFYGPLYFDTKSPRSKQQWEAKYPPIMFPVLAFTGAPAQFPVEPHNVYLQKYLKWSGNIQRQAMNFIEMKVEKPFLGVHFRRGSDFQNACRHAKDSPNLFSARQCLGDNNQHGVVTSELCYPSDKTIIDQMVNTVKEIGAKTVFIATDSDAMTTQLKQVFKPMKVKVVQGMLSSPHVDLCILGQADHFIGNCVSSFSAFVKRERDVNNMSSSFWAFPIKDTREEL